MHNLLRFGSADLSPSVQSGLIKGERGSAITVTESAEGLISVPRTAAILGHSILRTQRPMRSGNIEGQEVSRDWFTTEEAITPI
jgi:hypothetical protein